MIGAEVGDRSNVRVLVDNLGLAGGRLVSNVVDAVVLIGFAVGVDHGSVVSLGRETFFLQVSLLAAVPADDVGVPGTAGAGQAFVAGPAIVPLRQEAMVVTGMAAICSISCSVKFSQMIALASSGGSSALTALILCSFL